MIARLVLLAIPVLALGQDADPKEAWAKNTTMTIAGMTQR